MKVIYNDQEYLLVKQNSPSDIKTNTTITKYSELVKIEMLNNR